jgi:hypothetical protein
MFWGMLGLVLFNLRDPFWTRVFWSLLYFTCPGWLIPGGTDFAMIATPFANATIYLAIAYLILKLRRSRVA